MISSTENIVYELPDQLPNDLGLKILGNQEILGKPQKWVGAEPNTQFSFKK